MFCQSHFNLPEGSYGNGRGTEVVCIIAAFLRKAGPSLLRWPEGKTRRGRALAKRGGKLEDSPSLVRTRVLGLLLLCLLRRYSLLMLWTAFLCVVILQFNQ